MPRRLSSFLCRGLDSWTRRVPSKSPGKFQQNTRHAFFQDYRVFWFLLKLLGLFPYRVKKNGDVVFKFISKEMAYSVSVYCLITVPVLLVLRLRFRQLCIDDGNFEKSVYLYLMTILLIPHLGIPFTHWYELRQFQFIFKRWRQFQTLYENTFNEAFSLKLDWMTQLLLFILFAITTVVVIFNIRFFAYRFCWEMFAHLHLLALFFLHNLLLLGICCRLRVIARVARHRLIQAVILGDVSAVNQMSSFWVTFSEIIRLVGTLFYRMYSYLFMAIFSVATVLLYSLLCEIANHKLRVAMFHEYSLLLGSGAWVFFTCEFGERLTHDAGRKFILSLGKLRGSVKSSEMKYEIDSFIGIITSYPPYVTFNEYVTVNRKLFVSINGTMVTYLIVVFQFSQDHMDPLPVFHFNTTI